MHPITPLPLAKFPDAAVAWSHLLIHLDKFSGVTIVEKKTCVHIDHNGAAFLGVHPRKNGLRLSLVLDYQIESDRVVKAEQVSRRRFHNEVDLRSGEDIDLELDGWMERAYELRASRALAH